MKRYSSENAGELIELLKKRADSGNEKINGIVAGVLDNVKANGDAALREYSERFDGVKLSAMYMTEEEKEEACAKVSPELKEAMERAAKNIFAFHEKQKQQSWIDNQGDRIMGQRVLPLRRVGLYVPGGSAAYPSSVLMNAIPAKVAGVESIVIATPPKAEGINPAVAYAAKLAGVSDILTVGGAPCPVLGRVCMDMTLLDVSAADVSLWDAVPLGMWAEGEDVYRALTGIRGRVERMYTENGSFSQKREKNP